MEERRDMWSQILIERFIDVDGSANSLAQLPFLHDPAGVDSGAGKCRKSVGRADAGGHGFFG